LGNGLATIYPPEHVELAERIVEAGAVVSELPMTVSPDAKNFLPRNRIIAGVSLGVLVIEAARRSGALTTARVASEYNREVFAVPGRIDSEFSRGTNALIRDQHAKLVMSVDDIIDELGEVSEPLKAMVPAEPDLPLLTSAAMAKLNDDERHVFVALDRQGQSIEVIAEVTERSPSRVASLLLTLQIKGLARQLPGNMFIRSGA
jgi:DNA processing protein